MSWTELTVSICLPGSVGDAQWNAAADVDPHTETGNTIKSFSILRVILCLAHL